MAIVGALFEFVGTELVSHLIAHVFTDPGITHDRRASRQHLTRHLRAVSTFSPHIARSPREVDVLSSVPGRVRLRVSGVRGDPGRARSVVATLKQLPGVAAALASPVTGNVLVHYDPTMATMARLKRVLARPVNALPTPVREAAHLSFDGLGRPVAERIAAGA